MKHKCTHCGGGLPSPRQVVWNYIGERNGRESKAYCTHDCFMASKGIEEFRPMLGQEEGRARADKKSRHITLATTEPPVVLPSYLKPPRRINQFRKPRLKGRDFVDSFFSKEEID